MSEQVTNRNGRIGPLVVVCFLAFVIVSIIYGIAADSDCARGGYSAYRAVSGVRLCIGVKEVDGLLQWQIEPLDTVRDRLGEK